MTQNALSYLALQETNRHQTAVEAETNRHNVVTEGETLRSNVARENENLRSHLAEEANVRFRNVSEANHWAAQDAENMRSNMARESETIRSNNLNYFVNQQNVLNNALGNLNTAVGNIINLRKVDIEGAKLGIEQFNADTSRYKAEQDASIGWANVQINQQQANTAWQQMYNQASRWESQTWADKENARANMINAQSQTNLNKQKIKESKTNQFTSVINSAGNLLRGVGSLGKGR